MMRCSDQIVSSKGKVKLRIPVIGFLYSDFFPVQVLYWWETNMEPEKGPIKTTAV